MNPGPWDGEPEDFAEAGEAAESVSAPRHVERMPQQMAPAGQHVIVTRPVLRPEKYRTDEYATTGQEPDFLDDEEVYNWARLKEISSKHWINLTCLALIVASLVWKAAFLSHYYFRQDDFQILDLARSSSLSWSFLTHVDVGHFFPGVYFIAWVMSRVALYNWGVSAGLTLLLIAGASFAAWRALRTLLGNRPAIIIPLAIFVLTPLAFPVYSWWIISVEILPMEIAFFMAIDAHVRYVWTRQFKHAIVSAAWLVFGLIFYEKAAVIPLVLYAVTAGFLTRRPLRAALRITLVRLWRAWALYVGVLVVYLAVFAESLHTSTVQPGAPGTSGSVATFAWQALRESFVPGALGGPWSWTPYNGGTDAWSTPQSVLVYLSLVVFLALIAASIVTRPRAWRAWAILAGWYVVADVLPIAIGRLQVPGVASVLALDTRYVVDTAAVLALAVALAFWPVAKPAAAGQRPARPREFFTGHWRTVAIGLVGIFAVGSVWSVQDLVHVTTEAANRSYVASASAALAQVPAGTVVYGRQLVPSNLMSGLFGQDAEAEVVLRPLAHRGNQVSWTVQPTGTIDHLMVFGSTGQLYPATVTGDTSTSVPLSRSCTSARSGLQIRRFAPAASVFTQVLQIAYIAGPSVAGEPVTLTYGRVVRQVTIKRGLHNMYLAVTGSASTVSVQAPAIPGLCIGTATAGFITTSTIGSPVPAVPVPG